MNCIRLLKLAERQSLQCFKTSPVRCIGYHPIKFLETQEKWRETDNVSKRWQLIYKAPMDLAIKCISTYVTFSTTTIAIGGVYYAGFVFNIEEMNNPVMLGDEVVLANSATECLVYLGAFFAFHVALKVLMSKYVIRLYQDGDEYLAIFRGNMYNSIKKHKFRLDEFHKLKPTFVVSWGDARFGLGKKHAILLENYFKTPEHFNYLLYKRKKHKPEDEE
ncbi:uncharacterized protein LOC115454710 [Manduca sexta]|uniref:uncharacterized protein LOC115454710 n=1 Tax=Manduca sexta TaxID=7130 RepID=UPI0011834074|nr:uncharacterized protein LOC115454710 [Manduca sexta]